jgi:signal transduction histidine kinase
MHKFSKTLLLEVSITSYLVRPYFSKSSSIILVIIATVAVALSILSYHYSSLISNNIVNIASQELRSQARIQVHDFAQILANRLESIIPLLQTLADAPAIQNNEFRRAQTIIDYRKNYTNDLTDFYMWLDKDGKIVWISNINSTAYPRYKGFDLSYMPYFTFPKSINTAYYSNIIESNDKIPRLYISYPILSKQGSEYKDANLTKTGTFKGVVVTAIRLDTLVNLLKNQLFPGFESSMVLVDKNGIILYPSNQSYIGKSIFGEKFQSTLSALLSPKSHNSLNELFRTSLQDNRGGGGDGSIDIFAQDRMNTIAYEPVIVKGNHFLTLFITAPHNFASNVGAAIDQQKNFSIFIVIIIASLAIGISFLVLTWNRRLETIVNTRTAEVKKTNEQLVSAYEQLKAHDEMQRDFINVAAHELRTPIQPILGLTDALRSKIKDTEKQEILDVIIRNARRLRQLTEDILDVTRIESHTLELQKERFNLKDTLSNLIQDYRSQIERKNNSKQDLKILYEPKDDIIFVHADKARIIQVICNLINNSLKFTKSGKISINSKKNDSHATVSVEDTGTGIDPEITPKLFSKFATKSFSGTGLGLFISKSIIEAHGGKIWAENNSDGKGATFAFSLPIINE